MQSFCSKNFSFKTSSGLKGGRTPLPPPSPLWIRHCELVHGEKSILLVSLSGPYFALLIRTVKTDRSRINFTDLSVLLKRSSKGDILVRNLLLVV